MVIKSLAGSILQASGRIPLRVVLVVPFVIQIVSAVGLVGYLSFRNGQESVNNVASQLRSEISERISERLQAYMEEPYKLNQIKANGFALGDWDLQDIRRIQRHFWQHLQTFETVSVTYIGTPKGDFTGARRTPEGTYLLQERNDLTNGNMNYSEANNRGEPGPVIKVRPNFDARVRPWYQAAIATGKPTWSKIYTDFTSQGLGITAAQPLYDAAGNLQGVLGSDLLFLQVNQFLKSLKIGKSGQTFIIERSGELVSTSTADPVFLIKGEQTERISAAKSQNTLISLTAQDLQRRFGNFSQIQDTQQLNFQINDRRNFVQVTPLRDAYGLDWLIVVVVPESDFMEQIHANNRTTILLCLAALAIATGIGIITAQSIIKPILHLKRAASDLAEGNFNQTVPLDRQDELGVLAKAFNRMAQQLQESFADLEAKNQQLQQLDRLKDEFLANTSHELRTPLNGIIGIAESMIDGATGPVSDLQQQNLLLIAQSGHRLSNLVNDILDFSKLKNHQIELQLKPIHLREVAEVVLTLSRSLIGSKNLQLIDAIPTDLPPVNADENRLQQILYNLIGNAVKFTPSGRVQISAQIDSNPHDSPYLAITISDTGIGISADKLDRIFESFEQADGSTGREYGGTGLGLAVTKQLVELHGGEIYVASTVGSGSQFTFTLPLSLEGSLEIPSLPVLTLVSQEDKALSLATVSTSENPHLSTLNGSSLRSLQGNTDDSDSQFKILIVDDEPVNLQVLANHLSLSNYSIHQAANGVEVLDLLEQGFKPDLIVLDVMMPQMTGYEVTRVLRKTWLPNELPIVLLTAKNQVSDVVAGFEAGANDYLSKPISKDELLARIKTHINLSRLSSENRILSQEREELEQEKSDLEILLTMTTEHATAVEAELQQRALEAVQESERRLRNFLEAMPVGVFVTDASGKPYYINSRGQQLLNQGVVEDSTAEQLTEIYQVYLAGTDELYPQGSDPIQEALRGRTTTRDDIEIRQGERTVPIEVWGTPILNSAGKVLYAIAAFQDITERKKAETERNKFTEQILQINLAYERFVPKEFLRFLNKDTIVDVELGDQVQREMTVLFSDIRSFTTLSEGMTPEDNFNFLNSYLSRVSPVIRAHRGFIDKYIGDAIMALFAEGPDDAVDAAIAMQKEVMRYNEHRIRQNYTPIAIGIGLHTGTLMLGTIGEQERMESTVIADAVNLASRLEGLTKLYGAGIIISHKTLCQLDYSQEHSFRFLDRVMVKGKKAPVAIFEVYDGDSEEQKQLKAKTQSRFEVGVFLYYQQQFEEAGQIFQEVLQFNPQDKAAQLYVKRCDRYQKYGVPEEWEGVEALQDK